MDFGRQLTHDSTSIALPVIVLSERTMHLTATDDNGPYKNALQARHARMDLACY